MSSKTIQKNYFMNIILSMSSFVFPLITIPYASRILLPEGMGRVQFVTSTIMYFNSISQLGIPIYGIRTVARVRDNKEELTKVVHELLLISLTIGLLSYFVLCFMATTIPIFSKDKELYIIMGLSIIMSSIGIEWLFKGLEQYEYITIRSVLLKTISTIAVFLMIHNKSDYRVYGVLSIFASCGSGLINIINARRFISFKPLTQYSFSNHFRPIVVFFAMACAAQVYTQLDTIILGLLSNEYAVGIYSTPIKIKNVLVAFITALGPVILPRATYYIEQQKTDSFNKTVSYAFKYVVLMSFPLAIFFIIFSEQIILFLFGVDYVDSVLPMKIIMPTVLLIGLTNVIGIQYLIPIGKEKDVLFSEIIGAIVNLIVNVTTIPKLSVIGAATGALIAELSVLIYQLIVIKDESIFINSFDNIVQIMIALCFASLLSTTVSTININIFLTIALSGIVFFSTYLLVLYCLKERMVHELLNGFLKNII